MPKPMILIGAGIAAATLLATTAVRADEPGPGGTKPPVAVTGEQVYTQVCQSCHMANAKGAIGAGAIPALANNPKLAEAGYPIALLVNGRGAMPWFNDTLSAAQMAAVINYVRTHFGNTYRDAVTKEQIAPLLPAPAPR